MNRWFLRCRGCLAVSAIEMEGGYPDTTMRCTICEDRIEVMGRVHDTRARLVEDTVGCPCDARCTSAGGPNCDCSCGGKNHGSQILVKIIRDLGPVPRITPANPTKAQAVWKEWTEAKAETARAIIARFPQIMRKAQGENLGPWDTAELYRSESYGRAILRAGKLKTHHGRMAALKKITKATTAEGGK